MARAEALARRSKPLSQLLPSCGCGSTALGLFTGREPILCPVGGGQVRSVEALGLHLFLGDGAAEATFPESARDVFFVSLADVRNISHAETRWVSASRPNPLQYGPGLRLGDPVSTARTSAAGSAFIRSKRRESLLAHTSIPVPEAQRRSLTVSPGSETHLFNEDILSVIVAQVQQSSLISSNLAVSRSLGRGRGYSSSSSPLVDPSASGSSRSGRPHGKRSASSSRFGGRKRFRGGKGSAPSSRPSSFRK